MLDIKPFVSGYVYESDITKKLNDYLLFYKLNPAKKTGALMGMKTFNQLFNKFKGDYYKLFIHNLGDKQLLFKELGHWARIQKIKKYYTDGYYQNIEDIIIQGSNQVTPLLEALSMWVDYDLIKEYYKGFDIEKIDKSLWLWSIYYSNYYHIPIGYSYKHLKKYNSQDNDLISMNQRFNLLRFIWLLSRNEIPLVYKDGVLMLDEGGLFRDLSVYKANSVETAVKNIIKKLLSKDLSVNDFLHGSKFKYNFYGVIDVFPYKFVMGWTGYGYALNVYKFNLKSMGFEPVKNFVIKRHFIGSEYYLNDIKFVNVNNSSDMTGLINKLVKFWFDDEYMYFYAYYEGFIYKVKRSEVEFVRVDGRKYYFRIFGKHFILRGIKYHFAGVVTPVEDG